MKEILSLLKFTLICFGPLLAIVTYFMASWVLLELRYPEPSGRYTCTLILLLAFLSCLLSRPLGLRLPKHLRRVPVSWVSAFLAFIPGFLLGSMFVGASMANSDGGVGRQTVLFYLAVTGTISSVVGLVLVIDPWWQFVARHLLKKFDPSYELD